MKKMIMFIFAVIFISTFESYSQNWELAKNLDSNANDNKWDYIKSYDDKNVLIVGSDFNGIPRVIISEDAGKNWKYIYNTSLNEYMKDTSLKYHKPYAVHYDKDKIFILAYDNNELQTYFIKSFDKGNSWSKEKTKIGGNGIYFEENNGVIFAFDRIFTSSDNGNSWNEKPNNVNCTGIIEKIIFSSINKFRVLLVDQTNRKAWLYQTEDMALNWQIDTIPFYCRYRSFSFFDNNTGWVVGSYPNGTGNLQNDVILKTNDNCKTWQKVTDSAIKDSVSNPFGLYDIDVISKDEIIAVGSSKRAIYTSDGGLNWNLISKGLDNANLLFYSVKFLKPNVIIACGWDNLVTRLEFNPSTNVIENCSFDYSFIYPNPVTDYLSINSNQNIKKIEIFSTLGLKVLEAEWKEKIDVSGLLPGVYYMRFGNRVSKFIKF